MFEGTRRTLGFFLTRVHFRKTSPQVISFTSAVRSARRALLIMPLYGTEVFPTGMVISLLKKTFGEDNLTVVTSGHQHKAEGALPRSKFVRISESDLTSFFLPRKHIIRQINADSYDLALDLNLDLVLPSGYICRASAATVRIGFLSQQADMFYNLQIKPDPTLSKKLIYDRLAQCLRMF